MSHRSKPKKKRPHLVRNAFIVIFFILVSAIVIDALNQSNVGSTQSSTVSTDSVPLSSSDFYIVPTKGDCGFFGSSDNLKGFVLSAELRNNKDEPFHFVVAQILVANYTLTNGTVIASDQQQGDNFTSYGTSHSFSVDVFTKIPKSGPKISSIEFIATVYVQEVPGAITIPFNLPNANC